MNKEELKVSLEKYLQYLKNISENNSYIPTRKELNVLSSINKEKLNNVDLNNLLEQLKHEKDINRKTTLVDTFIKHHIIDNIEDKKDLLSKLYKIDKSKLEHRKLQDGSEIFLYFDYKLGRKKIIMNSSNQEILKQLENLDNKSKEIELFNISELYKKPELFKGLTKEELNNVKLLIDKVKALNLKFISPKKQIALDENNNIFQVYFDLEEGISKIIRPEEIVYENQNKKNNGKVDIQIDIEPEILSEINNYKFSDKIDVYETYNKIKYYHNHIKEIEFLPPKEKEFYKRMVVIYAVKNNKNKKVKQLKFENNPSVYMAGYVNIFIVSFITLLVLIILGIIYRLN